MRESLKHVWSGDSDLGDGSLQKLYDLYMERRNFYGKLGLGERRRKILTDLGKSLKKLEGDMLFLKKGEEESRQIYHSRLDVKNANQESLFSLAWEVEGYRRLSVSANELKDRMNKILCVYGLPVHERGNIPQELSMLRKDLLEYEQHLFAKHRDAVSHLLIFMVSDELRNMKPYAIPVRVMPFHSLTDANQSSDILQHSQNRPTGDRWLKF